MSMDKLESKVDGLSLYGPGVDKKQDLEKEVKEAREQAANNPDDASAHLRVACAILRLEGWEAYSREIGSIMKKLTERSKKNEFKELKEKGEKEIFDGEKQRFDSSYTVTNEFLGEGSYGKVYLGFKKKGKRTVAAVAVKVLEAQDASQKKRFVNFIAKSEREVKVWKKFVHPFILKLFDNFVLENKMMLVTEVIWGGSLEEYIDDQKDGKCSEQETQLVAKQLLLAVNYMHGKQAVSRSCSIQLCLLIRCNSWTDTLFLAWTGPS